MTAPTQPRIEAAQGGPQTVSTVEEIDALPMGTVLLDRDGTAWQFNQVGKWGGVGEFDDWYDSAHVARWAPLTLLSASRGIDTQKRLTADEWRDRFTAAAEFEPAEQRGPHGEVEVESYFTITRDQLYALALTTVETAEESGASLIAAERARQVSEEGYDAEHDQGHSHDLMLAAQAYASYAAGGRSYSAIGEERSSSWWPWAESYWKPTGDPVRDLTKAGALIAAAIDSLLLPVTPAPELEERP